MMLVDAPQTSSSVLTEHATTAQPRHVHFVQPTFHEAANAHELAMRAYEEQEREQRAMLRTFEAVLTEDFDVAMLENFLLYRATRDPRSILEILLVRNPHNRAVEGVVRYLRDQMFPEVEEEVWESWVKIVRQAREEDLFWGFVVAMTLDEGVMNMVRATWGGSQKAFDCLITYYKERMKLLLESPFDPENANTIMVGMWNIVRRDVLPMNMRAIILNGELQPVVVPLSRNAHRLRKQEMRQTNFENMLEMTQDGLA